MLVMTKLQEIIPRLYNSAQLYGAFWYVSAHCFGFTDINFVCFGSFSSVLALLFPDAT